eukprot:9208615-Pyramimonas_sp.AAC.3
MGGNLQALRFTGRVNVGSTIYGSRHCLGMSLFHGSSCHLANGMIDEVVAGGIAGVVVPLVSYLGAHQVLGDQSHEGIEHIPGWECSPPYWSSSMGEPK